MFKNFLNKRSIMEERLSKLEISIVIPVFNEAENIHFLSNEIAKSLKKFRHEIIFVDDGSNDNTKIEVLNLTELKQVRLICHKNCQGQSVAMRSGIINSKSNLRQGRANEIEFLPAKNLIFMKGNTELYQENMKIISDEIYYDLDEDRILKSVNSKIINN